MNLRAYVEADVCPTLSKASPNIYNGNVARAINGERAFTASGKAVGALTVMAMLL